MNSILTKSQKKTFKKNFRKDGKNYKIIATVRYDDQCNNGHNSFSITGDVRRGTRHEMGGCIHDEIAKHFPGLKKYLKWHLMNSDGPMHYLANTMYHADDKDYNGLRKGESKQIRNGKTGLLCWILKEHKDINRYVDSNEKPILHNLKVEYEPLCNIGEGKEPDLEAARSTAIWPEATLEQLRDKKALEERLPTLIKEFKHDVEEFRYSLKVKSENLFVLIPQSKHSIPIRLSPIPMLPQLTQIDMLHEDMALVFIITFASFALLE